MRGLEAVSVTRGARHAPANTDVFFCSFCFFLPTVALPFPGRTALPCPRSWPRVAWQRGHVVTWPLGGPRVLARGAGRAVGKRLRRAVFFLRFRSLGLSAARRLLLFGRPGLLRGGLPTRTTPPIGGLVATYRVASGRFGVEDRKGGAGGSREHLASRPRRPPRFSLPCSPTTTTTQPTPHSRPLHLRGRPGSRRHRPRPAGDVPPVLPLRAQRQSDCGPGHRTLARVRLCPVWRRWRERRGPGAHAGAPAERPGDSGVGGDGEEGFGESWWRGGREEEQNEARLFFFNPHTPPSHRTRPPSACPPAPAPPARAAPPCPCPPASAWSAA